MDDDARQARRGTIAERELKRVERADVEWNTDFDPHAAEAHLGHDDGDVERDDAPVQSAEDLNSW